MTRLPLNCTLSYVRLQFYGGAKSVSLKRSGGEHSVTLAPNNRPQFFSAPTDCKSVMFENLHS